MYGWPLLVHYCDACHYNTAITYSTDVWTQNHLCAHCGLTSPGADLAGQAPAEMNQAQHDELADMFAQSMQLSHQHNPPQPIELPPNPEKSPIHFISTHYTPTAHLRPADTTSEPSRSPPPPYNESLIPEAMADILRENSIDPASLLPNQAHLFLNGDPDQRLRLLELWRIAPPSYPQPEHGTWTSTTMEREETLARARWERRQNMETETPHPISLHIHPNSLPLQTSTPTTPISPIREPGETPWPPAARLRAASIAMNTTTSRPETRHGEAEPYITSGYMTRSASESEVVGGAKTALDPVYAAAAGLWQAPSYAQALEDQYGLFEQMRDWEAGGGREVEMEMEL